MSGALTGSRHPPATPAAACVVQDMERIREQQVVSGKEIGGLCEGLMQRVFLHCEPRRNVPERKRQARNNTDTTQ